ncbi:hypothetical protein SAMN05216350_106259 [Polaromonas sp. YR568]|uniref:hypothetical protein n=1 Tax=Polaromonas sp. YR568 TaxID=1855301 RepID=UPI0008EBF123|nr:hypothetical protein [Polaromonas sp. YR568]SFU86088.1 hypothetical protein SAMN05216350_106259 [Polaromonas sp. YR568]
MTTLEIMADRPSAIHDDFVSTDAADLASHMDQCAHSRGRFFGLQTGLQSAHSVMSPRIVTVAAIMAICFALLAVA